MAFTKEQLDAYIQALYDDDGKLSNADYQLIVNYILSNGDPSTNPRDLIQIRRGNEKELPLLAQGEQAFTLDTEKFFIGGLTRNIEIGDKNIKTPKQFGCIGDGVADDTNAMQLCLDSGGTILSSISSKYKITRTLNITKPIFIIGLNLSFTGVVNGINSVISGDQFTILNCTFNTTTATLGICLNCKFTGFGETQKSVDFKDFRITGQWGVGIKIEDGYNVKISNGQIIQPSITPSSIGIECVATGVGALIENILFYNIGTGIKQSDQTDSVRILKCHFKSCNTGIFFNYNTTNFGAILAVVDSLFQTIQFGIRAVETIAVNIDKCFFQKDFVGTWVGVELENQGIEVNESYITDCSFGNNLGTTPWVGINMKRTKIVKVSSNQFDSGSGTSILLTDVALNNIIDGNINVQANTFMTCPNTNVTNRIYNNMDYIRNATPSSDNLAVNNPPNLEHYKGGNSDGLFYLYNTGGAITISDFKDGGQWQRINVIVKNVGITFANGAKMKLKGGINYVATLNSVISFIAIPDPSQLLIWTEISRVEG